MIYVGNTADENSLRLSNWGGQGYVTVRGAQPLYLGTSNATRVTVTAAGKVGIGTTAPGALLDSDSNANWSGGWRNNLRLTSDLYPCIRFYSQTINKTSLIGNNNDGGLWFAINGSGNAVGSYAMVIQPDGNVGIGTTTPGSNYWSSGGILHIKANFPGLVLESNSGRKFSIGSDYSAARGGWLSIRDETGNADRLVVDASGNVGIGIAGTTAITQKLHVAGTASITGAVTAGGNIELSHASTPHFQLQQTSGNKWRWYSDGTDSYIRNATGGWNVAKFTANADVGFYNSDGSATPFLWDASAERLGIGNTAPKAKLHVGTSPLVASDISTTAVFATNVAGAAYPLTISNTDTPTNGDSARMSFSFYNSWSATAWIGAVIENTVGALTGLGFATYGPGGLVERVRIATDGNVGIGVTDPDAKLEIKGTGGASGLTFKTTDNANNENFFIMDGGRMGLNYYPFTIGIPSSTAVSGGTVKFQIEEAGLFTVRTDGNIGIGTVTPVTQNGDMGTLVSIYSSASSKNTAISLTYTGGSDSQWAILEGRNNSSPAGEKRVAQIGLGNPAGGEQDRGAITFGVFRDGSYTEAARIISDGKVGIGTTAPASLLHVQTLAGGNYTGEVRVGGSNTTHGMLLSYTQISSTEGSIHVAPGYTNANALFKLRCSNGDTNQLVLKGDGNVGIGNAAPSSQLEVSAPGNGNGIKIQSTGGAVNRAPALHLNPLSTSANERNWSISPYRDHPESLSFASSNAKGGDGYSAATTRFIINGISGNVGIGTTAPSALFHVYESSAGEKNWYMENAGSGVGQLNIKGGSGRYMSLARSGTVGTILVDGAFKIMNHSGGWNTSIYCTAAGDVGIGHSNVYYKLDVSGTFRATGQAYLNGGLRIGGSNANCAGERLFNMPAFANGVANQKIDLYWTGAFWGYMEIEITSSYSNQNASGILTKSFALGLNASNAIYSNESWYSNVGGVTNNNFAISGVTWDSTNSRYRIQIVHRTSTGNGMTLKMRCLGAAASHTDTFMSGTTVSAVYTTDTTAFALPVVQLAAPNDNAWVGGYLGIGTATPAARLHIHNTSSGAHGLK